MDQLCLSCPFAGCGVSDTVGDFSALFGKAVGIMPLQGSRSPLLYEDTVFQCAANGERQLENSPQKCPLPGAIRMSINRRKRNQAIFPHKRKAQSKNVPLPTILRIPRVLKQPACKLGSPVMDKEKENGFMRSVGHRRRCTAISVKQRKGKFA